MKKTAKNPESVKIKLARAMNNCPLHLGVCRFCGLPGADGYQGTAGDIKPAHGECMHKVLRERLLGETA